MLEFGTCPQCKLDISEERKKALPIVCDKCGYTVSNSDGVQEQVEKRSIIWFAGISVFIVLAHIQLANWDKHSLSIIPIALKETLGMDNAADAERKSEICFDLKKWDCVEASFVKSAKSSGDNTLWVRAGDFQMKRAHYNEAAQSYYSFFTAGGENLETSYNYAKALAQLGQVDEAVKYFDQVLAAKPDTLQVTVVQNYVKLLMDHQRYDQAKVLITQIRNQAGATAELFMEEEFKKIHELTTASRE
jgi:tetratricopeptide (TPR) repeat protein